MTGIDWTTTKDETATIVRIARRAQGEHPGVFDFSTLTMDLTACHRNGCPLDLTGLAEADGFNFIHDVTGISQHIDRKTGELDGCFMPRFARVSP